MANPIQTATRRAAATQRLLRAADAVRKKHPKTELPAITSKSKDADVNGAELLESIASFMEALGDVKPLAPQPISGYIAPPDQRASTARNEPTEFVTKSLTYGDDKLANSEDIRTVQILGKPLSFYDGKSDDEILEISGMTPAILQKIIDARKARDKRGDD